MKEYISPVIVNRFPGFVKDNYPAFARFLQDYFTWLEEDEGFLQILNDWKVNREPSLNVEPYIDAIIRDVGFALERPITVPKSTLLHMLRDFYLSRGTQQSFKFLFKLLFDEDVQIEYPREKLLWLSSANYGERHYVFLKSTQKDSREYKNIIENVSRYAGTVYGSLSQITSFVEAIEAVQYNGGEYLKVEIQRPQGEFLPQDLMTLTVGDWSITEQIMSVVGVEVENEGTEYQAGDQIIITGADVPGTIRVNKTSTGGITGVEILDPGCAYDVGTIILARTGAGGSGFTAQVTAVSSSTETQDFISAVEVLSPGYGYESIPEIFAKRKDESIIFDPRYEASQRKAGGNVILPVDPDTGMTFSSGTNVNKKRKITGEEAEIDLTPSGTSSRFSADSSNEVVLIEVPCIAELKAHSSEIGKIKILETISPYITSDINGVSAFIQSKKGKDAVLSIKPITRYSVSAWEDNKGFLEERCTLIDSDKYQQFSYEVISPISPSRYQDVVDDLLHPVGYIRSSIVEIEAGARVNIRASDQSITRPLVLQFAIEYKDIQPSHFSVTSKTFGDRIVVAENQPLVDEAGNNIVWI